MRALLKELETDFEESKKTGRVVELFPAMRRAIRKVEKK